MINNIMFTKRLQEILGFYKLSASAFAEKMGVGRSSISHIISGRNKPSLEFVLHILENFDEVTFDWLMLGKGDFPKKERASEASTLFSNQKTIEENKTVYQSTSNLFSNTPNTEAVSVDTNANSSTPSIDRIVIFYSDNSFKEYKN